VDVGAEVWNYFTDASIVLQYFENCLVTQIGQSLIAVVHHFEKCIFAKVPYAISCTRTTLKSIANRLFVALLRCKLSWKLFRQSEQEGTGSFSNR
tara:strand:- start:437 stop:721 length:285 start_codon:yes stop_codon:yes gene_type:complete